MEKGFFNKYSAPIGSDSGTNVGMNVDVAALSSRMKRLKGLDDGTSSVAQPRKAIRVLRNPSLEQDDDEAGLAASNANVSTRLGELNMDSTMNPSLGPNGDTAGSLTTSHNSALLQTG